MTEQQIELLAEIQRLALACRDQTGARIVHEVQAWPDGGVWSECRIIGDDHREVFDSVISVLGCGREERIYSDHGPSTLLDQRDALATWIAENRKERAA